MGHFKTLIKRCVAKALSQIGPFHSRPRVVVLCYHSVHPTKPFSSATPRLFEQHVAWLIQNCKVVDFSQIPAAVEQPVGDRPVVAVTFDDGYADNYDFAFPILKKYGLLATFFTTVGLLERDPQVLARLMLLRRSAYNAIRPLEWCQVREMLAGGMAFGAHTYSHPNLARLDRHALRRELVDAKKLMEDRVGTEVTSMAYPFGKPQRHFDDETVEAVREAEYHYAGAVLCRSVSRSDSRLAIPRMFVTADSLATLREKVGGAWDLVGRWQETAPLWAARIVSAADFIE